MEDKKMKSNYSKTRSILRAKYTNKTFSCLELAMFQIATRPFTNKIYYTGIDKFFENGSLKDKDIISLKSRSIYDKEKLKVFRTKHINSFEAVLQSGENSLGVIGKLSKSKSIFVIHFFVFNSQIGSERFDILLNILVDTICIYSSGLVEEINFENLHNFSELEKLKSRDNYFIEILRLYKKSKLLLRKKAPDTNKILSFVPLLNNINEKEIFSYNRLIKFDIICQE